jgi:predicted DNA-binding protein
MSKLNKEKSMTEVKRTKQNLTTVQIPMEVYQLLKELAEREHRSVASYARVLIMAKHVQVFKRK